MPPSIPSIRCARPLAVPVREMCLFPLLLTPCEAPTHSLPGAITVAPASPTCWRSHANYLLPFGLHTSSECECMTALLEGEFGAAYADLQKAEERQGDNSEIAKLLAQVKKAEALDKKRKQQQFGKMFG